MAISISAFCGAIALQPGVPTFSVGQKTGPNSIDIPDSDFWINFDDDSFALNQKQFDADVLVIAEQEEMQAEALAIVTKLRDRITDIRAALTAVGFSGLSDAELALFLIDMTSTRTFGLCSPTMLTKLAKIFPKPGEVVKK